MRFQKECAWPAGPPEKVSVRRKSRMARKPDPLEQTGPNRRFDAWIMTYAQSP